MLLNFFINLIRLIKVWLKKNQTIFLYENMKRIEYVKSRCGWSVPSDAARVPMTGGGHLSARAALSSSSGKGGHRQPGHTWSTATRPRRRAPTSSITRMMFFASREDRAYVIGKGRRNLLREVNETDRWGPHPRRRRGNHQPATGRRPPATGSARAYVRTTVRLDRSRVYSIRARACTIQAHDRGRRRRRRNGAWRILASLNFRGRVSQTYCRTANYFVFDWFLVVNCNLQTLHPFSISLFRWKGEYVVKTKKLLMQHASHRSNCNFWSTIAINQARGVLYWFFFLFLFLFGIWCLRRPTSWSLDHTVVAPPENSTSTFD